MSETYDDEVMDRNIIDQQPAQGGWLSLRCAFCGRRTVARVDEIGRPFDRPVWCHECPGDDGREPDDRD